MAEEEAPRTADGGPAKAKPLRQRLRQYSPQVLAALVATLGAFSLGSALGWSSPAGPIIAEEHYEGDVAAAGNMVTWIGSILTLGGFCSMILMGVVVDRMGRKVLMLILMPPLIIGWIILAFGKSTTAYLIGRFITGFCSAAFCVVAPVYIGEIAQKEIRGTLGVFYQLLLVLGVLYSYTTGLMKRIDFLSYMNIIPNVVLFASMIFMPESPRLLLSRDQREAAMNSLQWFRGKEYDIEPELKEMEDAIIASNERKGSLKDMFTQKSSQKATGIAALLMFCQQLSGINVVIFYSVGIFEEAGTGLNANISAIILGVVQVCATFVAALTVDRLGRRVLLIVSHAGMAVCLIVLGAYFYVKEQDEKNVERLGWLALTSTCVYLLSFSLGSGPVPWAMMGELFPSEVKGIAGSFCGSINWLVAFAVTKSFDSLQRNLGNAGCYWLYAGLCLVGTVLIFIFVIETKNKTLEEIQKEFGGRTE